MPVSPRVGGGELKPLGVGLPGDALGFPVPRFPTARPMLDADGFVASPRTVATRRVVSVDAGVRSLAMVRRSALAPVLLFAAAAALVLAPQWEVLTARLRPSHQLAEPAPPLSDAGIPAARFRKRRMWGGPRPCFLCAARRSSPSAIARPRSPLWTRPRSTRPQADEARQAAETLARLPGGEDSAANAYLRAFKAGMAKEHWGAAAAALERAGRAEQARRRRALSK